VGDPAKRGCMGYFDDALGHHGDHVPVRQPIRDVPSQAQLDDFGAKHQFAADRVAGNRLDRSATRAILSGSAAEAPDVPEQERVEPLVPSIRSLAASGRQVTQLPLTSCVENPHMGVKLREPTADGGPKGSDHGNQVNCLK